MFKSLTKTNQKQINQSHDSDDSFVHVMDIDGGTTPETVLALKVTPRHDRIGLQAKQAQTLFCASMKAYDLPEDDDSRAPVDIVVALDVSRSMHGKKLKLCKETLILLLRELSARDRFGLVTYSNEATIRIPARKLTKKNKEIAVNQIKKLKSSAGTNISGGIGLAAQELKSIESPNEVQTVFLLTDGLATLGIRDRKSIALLTKGCLNMDETPVAIHCFGYGADHDADMLQGISQATDGGTYYFVKNDSDVSSAFGDALGGILSVVAQNAVLKLDTSIQDNGVRIIDVLHDKAIKQEDGSFNVPIGDFYSGESRDIIFNVALASGLDFGWEPVVHVSVSMTYLDTINKKLARCDTVEGSIARPNGSEISESNEHVALQHVRIITTGIIAEAEEMANSNNLDAAKAKIQSHIDYLSNNESDTPFDLCNPLISQLTGELNTILSSLSSFKEWHSGGSCYSKARYLTHKTQRCSESSTFDVSVYRSPKKEKLCLSLQQM